LKTIRGGMGLGDALYVQAVARHLVARGARLQVATSWPDVFKRIDVQTVPFRRSEIDILAHYSRRKNHRTGQFEDVCIQAGIDGPVELRLDWSADTDLTRRLRADGRPIVCVQLPRSPMGRSDGFGAELLPDCKVIQRAIDSLAGRALVVQIGAGQALFRFRGIDVDLSNETTVAELLDVASVADGFLGYVSFLVPLAESFSKPAMLVWSKRGLRSPTGYIRQITPAKVLHRSSSMHVIDDWRPDDIRAVEERFWNAIRRPH
jgi:hypothetical protein